MLKTIPIPLPIRREFQTAVFNFYNSNTKSTPPFPVVWTDDMISDIAFCVCLDIVVFFEMAAERVGLVPSAVADVAVAVALAAVPDFRGNAMFDNFVVSPVLVAGERFMANSVRAGENGHF